MGGLALVSWVVACGAGTTVVHPTPGTPTYTYHLCRCPIVPSSRHPSNTSLVWDGVSSDSASRLRSGVLPHTVFLPS